MKSLRTYLKINSLFSLATGVLMAVFSDELLTFFAVPMEGNLYLFDIIGLNLILFSLFVWYVAAKQVRNSLLVKVITILDIAWVIGSMIIVGFQLYNLSEKGYFLIAVIAVWIGFLAYKQFKLNTQKTR